MVETLVEGTGDFALAALVVIACIFIGWLVDVIVVRGLRNRAQERGWRWSLALAKALHWQPEIWGAIVGVALLRPLGLLPPGAGIWVTRINMVALILSLTVFASRLVGWVIRGYLAQDRAPSGTIFVNLARAVVWTVGLLLVMGSLGIQIGPLVASLGIVGLAVSLGLQDTLANVFNGVQLTVTRDLQPGDVVRLSSGEEGTVEDVTWRVTTLRTPGDDLILVPNAVLGRSVVTKLSGAESERTFPVAFTVQSSADISHACTLAVEVARHVQETVTGAVREFEPTCRSRGFSAGGVTLAITLRAEGYADRFAVIDAFVRDLHDRYREEGIEFAAPPLPPKA